MTTDPQWRVLLVASCGATKARSPRAARELYTGPYASASISAALHCAAVLQRNGVTARVRIASARHGLLDPDRVVSPYEQELVDHRQLVACLRGDVELARPGPVIVLAGSRYLHAAREVAPRARRPGALEQARGIGDHLRLFRQLREDERPWRLLR